MIFDAGTTTVSTAVTEVQISNTTNKVRWIKVKALAANSGKVIWESVTYQQPMDMSYQLVMR